MGSPKRLGDRYLVRRWATCSLQQAVQIAPCARRGIPLRHRDSGLSKADVVRHLAFGNWDTRMTGPPKKAVSISISA